MSEHKIPLPHLDIVSLRDLVLHEDVERHRVDRIARRLAVESTLANPPIVGTRGGERRFIVLDGASRVTAARQLGYPHLLVQRVSYPSPEIQLDRWHHLVVGMDLAVLSRRARGIDGVVLERTSWSRAQDALESRGCLACLQAPGRRPVLVQAASPQVGMQPVRDLTALYATDPGLHRVREDEVAFPREWLGTDRVLVLFPRYRQKDIVRFSLHEEDRLPMGITRHTVPNRALRVHVPTSWLRSGEPLARKRRRLARFLEERWESGRIRHYPEATTLYDE